MQLFKFILTALISCDKPTTVAAQHQMAGSYLVLPAKQLETTVASEHSRAFISGRDQKY